MTAVHQWLFGALAGEGLSATITSVSSASAAAGEDIVHTITCPSSPVTTKARIYWVGPAIKGVDFSVPVNADLSNGVTFGPGQRKLVIPPGVTSFTLTVHTLVDADVADEDYRLVIGGVFGVGTITVAAGPTDVPLLDPEFDRGIFASAQVAEDTPSDGIYSRVPVDQDYTFNNSLSPTGDPAYWPDNNGELMEILLDDPIPIEGEQVVIYVKFYWPAATTPGHTDYYLGGSGTGIRYGLDLTFINNTTLHATAYKRDTDGIGGAFHTTWGPVTVTRPTDGIAVVQGDWQTVGFSGVSFRQNGDPENGIDISGSEGGGWVDGTFESEDVDTLFMNADGGELRVANFGFLTQAP